MSDDNGRAGLAHVLDIDPTWLVPCKCGRWIAVERPGHDPRPVGYIRRQKWIPRIVVHGRLVAGATYEILCDCGHRSRWYLPEGSRRYSRTPPRISPDNPLIGNNRRRAQDSEHQNAGSIAQRGPGARTEASGDSGAEREDERCIA
jgi:hypothetical protein